MYLLPSFLTATGAIQTSLFPPTQCPLYPSSFPRLCLRRSTVCSTVAAHLLGCISSTTRCSARQNVGKINTRPGPATAPPPLPRSPPRDLSRVPLRTPPCTPPCGPPRDPPRTPLRAAPRVEPRVLLLGEPLPPAELLPFPFLSRPALRSFPSLPPLATDFVSSSRANVRNARREMCRWSGASLCGQS